MPKKKDYKVVVDIHACSDVDGEYTLVDSTDTKEEAVERLRVFFTQLFCTIDAGFDMDESVDITAEEDK